MGILTKAIMGDIFDCKKCGKCCQGWGSKIEGSMEAFSKLEEHAINTGVYILVDPKVPGLMCWDWEVARIIESGKGAYEYFTPYYAIYEPLNDMVMTYGYSINGERCPFLEDNQCSIYDVRPMTCRSFPLKYNPYQGTIKEIGMCHCNSIEDSVKKRFKNTEMLNEVDLAMDIDLYGLVEAAKFESKVNLRVERFFNYIVTMKVIEKSMKATNDEVKGLVEKGEYENLFDYIVRNKFFKEGEIEKLIGISSFY